MPFCGLGRIDIDIGCWVLQECTTDAAFESTPGTGKKRSIVKRLRPSTEADVDMSEIASDGAEHGNVHSSAHLTPAPASILQAFAAMQTLRAGGAGATASSGDNAPISSRTRKRK